MAREQRLHTIRKKDKSKLEQKLPTQASQDNGIKADSICHP